MQGPGTFLDVATYPPGATSTDARIVIDGDRGAIFVYTAGNPLGSLVGSWAETAGTDPYGNAFGQGITTYSGTSLMRLNAAALLGHITGITTASDAGAAINADGFSLNLFSAGAQGNAGADITHIQIYNGHQIGTDLLTVWDPVAKYPTLETWHNLGTIASGWSVGNRARYKLMPDNTVTIDLCNIHPPATAPSDGTAVWTAANGLPSGWRPSAAGFRTPAYADKIGTEAPAFAFNNDGSITVYGVGSVNPTRLDCQARIPLD